MSGLRDELAALIRGWDQTTMSPHAAQLVLRDSADEVRALLDRFPPEAEGEGDDELAAAWMYVDHVSRIVDLYRGIVMDTPEDRALHQRVIDTADRSLNLFRDRVPQPTLLADAWAAGYAAACNDERESMPDYTQNPFAALAASPEEQDR